MGLDSVVEEGVSVLSAIGEFVLDEERVWLLGGIVGLVGLCGR